MYVAVSTPLARNIVRGVFRARRPFAGLTSHDIYNSALELFPDAKTGVPPPTFGEIPVENRKKLWKLPPQPTNGEHPIRSLKFLKTVVLEDMAAKEEIVKVNVRRLNEKDEQDRPLIMLRCLGQQTPVPYEQRHPDIDKEKIIWLWRHIKPDLLEKDEPVTPTDIQQLHLREEFESFGDPNFQGANIKFVDEVVPQEPRRQNKPRRKMFGQTRGQKSDS